MQQWAFTQCEHAAGAQRGGRERRTGIIEGTAARELGGESEMHGGMETKKENLEKSIVSKLQRQKER